MKRPDVAALMKKLAYKQAEANRTFGVLRKMFNLAEVWGQSVADVYRRSVMLVSGRYAMLDDSLRFSLVSWRPVIEQRPGQHIAVTVRGSGVSWEIGLKRGPSI